MGRKRSECLARHSVARRRRRRDCRLDGRIGASCWLSQRGLAGYTGVDKRPASPLAGLRRELTPHVQTQIPGPGQHRLDATCAIADISSTLGPAGQVFVGRTSSAAGADLGEAVAPGHGEPRKRRGRQMPAPARRQGSRRAIRETPYRQKAPPEPRRRGNPRQRSPSSPEGSAGQRASRNAMIESGAR
jgi:hypothetical protein